MNVDLRIVIPYETLSRALETMEQSIIVNVEEKKDKSSVYFGGKTL